MKTKRKIVHFVVSNGDVLFVLCDDGTMWMRIGNNWNEISTNSIQSTTSINKPGPEIENPLLDKHEFLAKCPYCGFKNIVHVKSMRGKIIVTCSLEDGGCDEDFIIYYSLKVQNDNKIIPLPGVGVGTVVIDHDVNKKSTL